MRIKAFSFIVTALLFHITLSQSWAAYYDTLPKGVRLVAFRQVQTKEITDNFSQSGKSEPLSFHQSLNANELSKIEGADLYFEELKKISPEAYDIFSVGSYYIDAKAQVDVQGFGVAYGLTERLTTYVSIPYYRALVNMDIKRTQGHNYQEVASALNSSGQESDTSYFLNQLTSQLPDADGELLQTVLVKNFGYRPVGNWKAQGLGDIELTALYRLTDWEKAGLATSFGVVLPTGRVDNPNILQDIPFGDGQTDVFLEFGGGVSLLNDKFELDASFRYTHQFSSQKEFRVPQDSDMSFSSQTASFKETLAPKLSSDLMFSYNLNDWFTLQSGHEFFHEGQAEYESKYTVANEILAKAQSENYQTLKLGAKLSSIKLYQKGRFALPMSLQFLARKIITGKNTPDLTRFDLELRLFF